MKFLARSHPQLLQEVMRLFAVPDYYYGPENVVDDFFEEDSEEALKISAMDDAVRF